MYNDNEFLKKLGLLGFSHWMDQRANYKESQMISPILYDIRQWMVESLNVFIEIELDTDCVYFWRSMNTKTGKEIDRDSKGYDSPEIALEKGIKKTIIEWR